MLRCDVHNVSHDAFETITTNYDIMVRIDLSVSVVLLSSCLSSFRCVFGVSSLFTDMSCRILFAVASRDASVHFCSTSMQGSSGHASIDVRTTNEADVAAIHALVCVVSSYEILGFSCPWFIPETLCIVFFHIHRLNLHCFMHDNCVDNNFPKRV